MKYKIITAFVLLVSIQPIAATGDSFDVVFPERIHPLRSKRDLSTREQDDHASDVTFRINTKQKDYIIDLKRNDPIHTGSFKLRTFDEDGKAVHTDHTPENCYYHGNIRGNDDSFAFISTCRGLTGTVDDGKNVFDIEPHDDVGGHKFSDITDKIGHISERLNRNSDIPVPDEDVKYPEKTNTNGRKRRNIANIRKFELINVKPQYIPYLVTSQTRYIEMLVVADHNVYERYNNDTDLIVERMLNALGLVDKSYSAINIRIVVVGVEIQSNGPTFKRFKHSSQDLRSFNHYVRDVVQTSDAFKGINVDNRHLMSHNSWPGVGGSGYLYGMCTDLSAAHSHWGYTIGENTVTIGHELGHNLGFDHDGDYGWGHCKCLAKRGCFMGGSKGTRPGFTDCNLRSLARYGFNCINDYPIKTFQPKCGNGIKEDGEECDCGTPEMCTSTNNTCCEPYGCKVKAHKQCSYIDNPECCSSECLIRAEGTLCREANGNCDVPEYCTGDSAMCPADLTMKNGVSCGENIKVVYGTHGHTVITTPLSPHVIARYIKIIPKYWVEGGLACLRLGVLGCPINRGNDLIECKFAPGDGTGGGEIATGKRVNATECINICVLMRKKDPTINGVTHPKSGFGYCYCEQTMTGRNGNRNYQTCFIASGCRDPMGIADGTVPESALSAGSYHPENPVGQVRLNRVAWCPESIEDGSWFQVDFGKRIEISNMQVGGTYYNHITGYHLMYSDDGVTWQGYKESGTKDMNSLCYNGKCSLTYDDQCRNLWGSRAKKAADSCWKELNTKMTGYGSCSTSGSVPCAKSNIFCGQLQCMSSRSSPYYVNYASSYNVKSVNGSRCSAANLTVNDEIGLGMVAEGTKCGLGKYCVEQKCITLAEHVQNGLKACPIVNGKECNGKGTCTLGGTCLCDRGLNSTDGCKTALVPVNGGWANWTTWSSCAAKCGVATKAARHRFCTQPVPKYGGAHCQGLGYEERNCTVDACPVGRSCKAIKLILEEQNKPLVDGVYTIKPKQGVTLKVYCDMTRNGGGWTLIVSSHTNTWTSSNVRSRNIDKPELKKDYSMLKYADDIKDSYLLVDSTFEYRLEASDFGLWGGIFEAPNAYKINSDNQNQVAVKLLKKFSNWKVWNYGIRLRLPYVYNHRLTTSDSPSTNFWGSITDNVKDVRHQPSKWIRSSSHYAIGTMEYPEHVWYWMREGDYKFSKTCFDIMKRSSNEITPFPSGIYQIEAKPGKVVQTHCDFDRHGGGWTLLTKTSANKEWTKEKALEHNSYDVSRSDYSIFGLIDYIKNEDIGEASFQYMIEANGNDQNGGIFSVPVSFSLLTNPPNGITPTILKKFGNWNESDENIGKHSIFASSKNNIFLSAIPDNLTDPSGTILSAAGAGTYMKSLKKPSTIKVWIREGGSRQSCNDLKIHGYHKGKTDYEDGVYMMANNQLFYCDMTTDANEGWTLLISAVNNGWAANEVFSRNILAPSIEKDYSILNKADKIKTLSNNNTFKYMMDARERRHWGGIWRAPMEYSFASANEARMKVSLLRKFSDWDYEVNWYRGPRGRMPYLGNPAHKAALLTTATYDDDWEWGSIVSMSSDGNIPSKWIHPQMRSPGVIWYWLNENDCESDYKKVDGGYSEWSTWSVCSCDTKTQTKQRQCNSPVPRCGGNPCDDSVNTAVTQTCKRDCYECKFENGDGKGGGEIATGKRVNAKECINICVLMKENDPTINGVTLPKSGFGYCYCEKGMTGTYDYGGWQTCFLKLID